ncbi:MAG: hypothetical protein ABI629_23755 [bacterium]
MPPSASHRAVRDADPARLAWLLPVAMAAVATAPILRNFFFHDDFFNLYQVVNDQPWWRFLLRMHGGHLLMTRNAVFILCYDVFGSDPRPYFALVLLTHLVNVALVYRIARSLTGGWRLACVAAGLWGIAPANLGTLGWYSVYGQVLATTAALWVLSRVAACATGAQPRPAAPLAWALVLMSGSTCFGVGIGFALVMPAIAWLLLPPSPLRRRTLLALGTVAVAMPIIYDVAYHLDVALNAAPPTTSLLLGRAMYFGEHGRVLAALLAQGSANVLFNGIAAPAWLAAALVLGAALYAGRLAGRRLWRPLLACALFAIGSYAVIAAGRSFLATASVDVVATADRYHYAGMIGVVLFAAVALAELGGGWSAAPRLQDGALLAWAVAATALVMTLRLPIDHHDETRAETNQVLEDIHRQISAAPAGSEVHIANRVFQSVGILISVTPALYPGTAAVFAVFEPSDLVDGRQVVFTTADAAVAAAARDGRRSGALVRLTPPSPDTTKAAP